MKKQPQGEELQALAKSLGVDTLGERQPLETAKSVAQMAAGKREKVPEFELQRRVIEAQRAQRESRLWLVALVSAIASVVSAIIALAAVLLTRTP